ncbi:hypothetical protein E0I56_005740 [Escherichia coli]|nr:hypothetical protein [Escherichia coli]
MTRRCLLSENDYDPVYGVAGTMNRSRWLAMSGGGSGQNYSLVMAGVAVSNDKTSPSE